MPIYPIDLVNGDPEGLNRHGGECRRTERSNLFATASIQLNGYPVGITDRDKTAFMPFRKAIF